MMDKPRLTFLSTSPDARDYDLSGTVSLGRAEDNTIRLADENVSRYHALIEERGGVFWLSDLGSLHGTTVNGAPLLAEHSLRDGDVISLGNTVRLRYSVNHGQAGELRAPGVEITDAHSTPAPDLSGAGGATVPASAPMTSAEAQAGLSPLHVSAAVSVGLLVFGVIALIVFHGRIWPKNDDHVPTPGPVLTPTVSLTPGPDDTDEKPSLSEIQQMANELAIEIAGVRGALEFGPEFLTEIRRATKDFRFDVMAEARAQRGAIRYAFSSEGIKDTLGFVLAISRSRYRPGNAVPGCGVDQDGIGLYLVPRSVMAQFGQGDASDPKATVHVAAKHLKDLMGKLGGPVDFIYAIACFGSPSARIGEVAAQANAQDRRNFWNLVKRNIINAEEASRAVCFFAAGIVAENPGKFDLANVDSLSTLYQ